jgi:hypothetical protein
MKLTPILQNQLKRWSRQIVNTLKGKTNPKAPKD